MSRFLSGVFCSIYPPRPCNREVTELRTAYPHHGNLTPPRISPSRFREYHYHPGCHRLHRELPYGLWRDSRSASPISEGSTRTSQVAITRTDVSVLDYSVFNVQQRSLKNPSTYINREGRFLHPFGSVFDIFLRKYVFCRNIMTKNLFPRLYIKAFWKDPSTIYEQRRAKN